MLDVMMIMIKNIMKIIQSWVPAVQTIIVIFISLYLYLCGFIEYVTIFF